jgi:hypothetical protein
MASDEEFSPHDFRVEPINSEQLRLVWDRDDGERRVIVVGRAQLPTVARELLKQVEGGGDATSPKIESLLSGKEARVVGLGFAPEPDHFGLTVYVELGPEQDQEVEIELRLSKADLISCVSSMTDWLERDPDKAD